MYFVKIVFFLVCLTLSSGQIRIIGGNETTIEKHPWQVSIQFFGVHSCGGAIIGPDTVLTAAHCVNKLFADLYLVVPGVTDLTKATFKVRLTEYIVHEKYDSDTYDYDIAILKLQEPLTYSKNIQPIALPNETDELPVGADVVASGWGVTDPNSSENSKVLRDVDIFVIDWETCKEKLSSVGKFTERMLCAGTPEGGKDTCQNDSGGPLEQDGTLVGIVSWGIGCGLADYPGVYTRVSLQRTWIKENSGI